jgi:UDP:flavonoid glycosyltransferase YjiC (YdhE family)
LAKVKPDLVVGDFRASLGVSAETMGVPFVNLCNAHWSPYSTQRFPVPELPAARLLGAGLTGLALRVIGPAVFRHQAGPYNKVRSIWGLPPVRDIRQMYTGGTWTLYLDLPELAPTEGLPDCHRYLGPVTWSPNTPLPEWWGEIWDDKRPLVYVTLGSSGDMRAVEALLQAASKLPVNVVMATAGRLVRARLPANVHMTDYLPGAEILRKSALCVFNGGAATGYQALTAGVPLLGLPSNADQFYFMESVVRAGAGLLVRPSRATEKRLVMALRHLLAEDAFRRSARRLAAAVAARPVREEFQRFVDSHFPPVIETSLRRTSQASVLPAGLARGNELRNGPCAGPGTHIRRHNVMVRTADSIEDLEAVWRLTHDEYVRMGYSAPRPDGMLRHYHLDGIPQTTVWVAEDDRRQIVGTVSLTGDNPAGLHVDDDFKDVVDGIRRECRASGKRLAASWRIVTRANLHNELGVIMGLVAAIMDEVVACPDLISLYTFNPRHEGFYRRMCGFELIAGPRPSRAVKDAPGILMRGDWERIRPVWERTRARRSSARLMPVTAASERAAACGS